MEAVIEKECSALGGLFQTIITDMKVKIWCLFSSKHSCMRTRLGCVNKVSCAGKPVAFDYRSHTSHWCVKCFCLRISFIAAVWRCICHGCKWIHACLRCIGHIDLFLVYMDWMALLCLSALSINPFINNVQIISEVWDYVSVVQLGFIGTCLMVV